MSLVTVWDSVCRKLACMARATSKSALDQKTELKANERDYILLYVFDTPLLYKKAGYSKINTTQKV